MLTCTEPCCPAETTHVRQVSEFQRDDSHDVNPGRGLTLFASTPKPDPMIVVDDERITKAFADPAELTDAPSQVKTFVVVPDL